MYVYSTELFKPTTIERMASDLKTIVECAVAAPNTRILDFSLSTSATDNKEGSAALNDNEPVEQLLAHLTALGLRLAVENGRLKVNAPKGALTEFHQGCHRHAP